MRLPLPPSGNHYKRHFCTRSSSRDPHTISAYLTERAKQFRADVEAEALVQRVHPVSGAVKVTVHVWCADNYDSDNVLKVLWDSLQGIGFTNDAKIREHHVYKHHAPHKRDYRVEVEIEAV